MADIPSPNPATGAKAALRGKSAGFYLALGLGIAMAVYLIRRRESQVIPAPNADALSTDTGTPPDPVSVGSFQGYDSAEAMPVPGSQLQGTDVLNFVLDWTQMKNDYLLQQADIQRQGKADAAAAAQAAAEAAASAVPTGGGPPDQPIPNVAPPPATAPAQSPCPSAFPQWNAAKGSPGKKSCYKDCSHHECSSQHRQYVNKGHCYQDGSRTHVGNDYTGRRC